MKNIKIQMNRLYEPFGEILGKRKSEQLQQQVQLDLTTPEVSAAQLKKLKLDDKNMAIIT